jgi:methionine-S-sulfoxide reductase
VIRTRVGYAGGSKENPAYYSLGDHSETIQIDYDPTQTSYRQLLEVFWNSHNPIYESWSRQYMSIIFYHSEEQKRLAIETKESEEAKLGDRILTEIAPFSDFYLAEDYHQKYYLRQEPVLMAEFHAIYPATEDFIASTAVTRVNGYVGGYGELATLERGLGLLGLSEVGRQRLLEIAARGLEPICPLPDNPS